MSDHDKLSAIKPVQNGIVNVTVPAQVFHDLDKMHNATKEILTRLGCGGCHSGFDIRFRQELEFHVNVDGKLR
jgi:hypothetical protein